MTDEQAASALASTAVAAVGLIVIATAWTLGLARLGARWAPRTMLIAFVVVFAAVEILLWMNPPSRALSPLVLAWAGIAMPLVATTTLIIVVLVVLTLFVAVVGLVRSVRRRAT